MRQPSRFSTATRVQCTRSALLGCSNSVQSAQVMATGSATACNRASMRMAPELAPIPMPIPKGKVHFFGATCSPDSAFGSEEISEDTGHPLEAQKSRHSQNFASTRNHTSPWITVVPAQSRPCGKAHYLPFQNALTSESSKGLRFKPFNEKEKNQWIGGHSDRGFIRLFDPNSNLKCSLVIPCSVRTTCKEICLKLGLKTTCLYLQYNGDVLKRLESAEKPLALQSEYLERIGLADSQRQAEMGDRLSLGFLVRFFAGTSYTLLLLFAFRARFSGSLYESKLYTHSGFDDLAQQTLLSATFL